MKMLAGLISALVWSSSPYVLFAQLPPGAEVTKEIEARFGASSSPVRVVFYQAVNHTVGFEVVSSQGDVLAGERVEATTLLNQTGVYDATGGGQPDIVLNSGVGQASQLGIYTLAGTKLRKLFSWSGASCRILHLGARPVLALREAPYGSLTGAGQAQTFCLEMNQAGSS